MKQRHAESNRLTPAAGKRVVANFGEASGEVGDEEQMRRPQAPLRAHGHGFVVNWELQEWLAAEQDWFPKRSGT
jgi:hypothetical protein